MDIENIVFVLKKVVTSLVTPPGIIVVLLVLSILLFKKRLGICVITLAVILYLVSIEPVKDLLLRPLEYAHKIPSQEEIKKCDAYVILGGGIHYYAPEFGDTGILNGESFPRVFAAFRLYQLYPKPIIPTGGKTYQQESESEITRKILLSFGVKREHILLISPGRDADTYENAEYAKYLSSHSKIRKPLLITSAFHMKRAVMIFNKFFQDITPFPTGYKTSRMEYKYHSFLPTASNLYAVALAIKEYMGIVVYKIIL